MSAFSEYILKSKSSVISFETIEIYHPSFTQTYRVVRNNTLGLNANLETGQYVFFQYVPMKIENAGVREDLDQSLKITFGDLGEILPKEMDAVYSSDTFSTKPVLKYRVYRSDDLSTPLYGPIVLEIVTFTFNKEGVAFDAAAPYLNISKTGEVYTLDRFPMLRGLL